jgi:hypothetical protein
MQITTICCFIWEHRALSFGDFGVGAELTNWFCVPSATKTRTRLKMWFHQVWTRTKFANSTYVWNNSWIHMFNWWKTCSPYQKIKCSGFVPWCLLRRSRGVIVTTPLHWYRRPICWHVQQKWNSACSCDETLEKQFPKNCRLNMIW